MSTRKSSYPGFDVAGTAAMAILSAMGPYRNIAEKALAKHAIWKIEPEGVYSLDAALGVFDTLIEATGTNTIFAIGKKVPDHATWPDGIDNIFQALQSVDIGYHLNHFKNGKPMFDPSTGAMVEGIGHYHYKAEGPRRIVMVCDNPYPSDFDRGLISTFARRYESTADVERDPTKPTRLEGADSCTFIVTF